MTPKMCQICGEHEWDRFIGILAVCVDCYRTHLLTEPTFDYFDEYPEEDPFESGD